MENRIEDIYYPLTETEINHYENISSKDIDLLIQQAKKIMVMEPIMVSIPTSSYKYFLYLIIKHRTDN